MWITTKKLTDAFVIILITGLFIIYDGIYQTKRAIDSEPHLFIYQAEQLYNEFAKDASKFQKKYNHQMIALRGRVTALQDSVIELDKKVSCLTSIDVKALNLKEGHLVTIKGRYIVYDSLHHKLKLNECLIEAIEL